MEETCQLPHVCFILELNSCHLIDDICRTKELTKQNYKCKKYGFISKPTEFIVGDCPHSHCKREYLPSRLKKSDLIELQLLWLLAPDLSFSGSSLKDLKWPYSYYRTWKVSCSVIFHLYFPVSKVSNLCSYCLPWTW